MRNFKKMYRNFATRGLGPNGLISPNNYTFYPGGKHTGVQMPVTITTRNHGTSEGATCGCHRWSRVFHWVITRSSVSLLQNLRRAARRWSDGRRLGRPHGDAFRRIANESFRKEE